jgi:hypothetical protein
MLGIGRASEDAVMEPPRVDVRLPEVVGEEACLEHVNAGPEVPEKGDISTLLALGPRSLEKGFGFRIHGLVRQALVMTAGHESS